MVTLFLLCGLPGAGKTTLARQWETSRQAIRFSPDEWIKVLIKNPADLSQIDHLRTPIESLQWSLAQKLLTEGVFVIRENGFWTKQERTQFQTQAKALGARVELHYLDVTKEELWRRIQHRNQESYNSSFPITREDFESWEKSFEVPNAAELQTYDNHTSPL